MPTQGIRASSGDGSKRPHGELTLITEQSLKCLFAESLHSDSLDNSSLFQDSAG